MSLMSRKPDRPAEDRTEKIEPRKKTPYQAPTVESIQLSPEAAEALT
jgi:hypothetical protein